MYKHFQHFLTVLRGSNFCIFQNNLSHILRTGPVVRAHLLFGYVQSGPDRTSFSDSTVPNAVASVLGVLLVLEKQSGPPAEAQMISPAAPPPPALADTDAMCLLVKI